MTALLNNFAFQLGSICFGFIALFWLLNMPEDSEEGRDAIEKNDDDS